MTNNSAISRRAVVKGAAAATLATAAVGTVAPVAAMAEAAQTYLSTDAVSFLYIESSEISAGAEQLIAICFNTLSDISAATLTLRNTDTSETLEVALANAADTSVLFTFEPDGGTYAVEQVTLTAGGSEALIDFTDFDASKRSFAVSAVEESLSLLSSGDVDEGALPDTNYYADDASEEVEAYSSLDEAVTANGEGTESLALNVSSPNNKTTNSKTAEFVIGIDPGHSYGPSKRDQGASAYNKSLLPEGAKTWPIAWYCMEYLEQYDGVKCCFSREYDANPTMEQRVQNCKDQGAEIVVSFHLNSASAAAKGCEVLVPGTQSYYHNAYDLGKSLGNNILAELEKLGIYNRGLLYRYTSGKSDITGEVFNYATGEQGDYYGIVRHARKRGMTGIIIEHCFMTNKTEYETYLSTEAGLHKLALADAQGIAATFGLKKKSEVSQDTTPKTMHRLYNPNSGEHFYTASTEERDSLTKVGWKYEGTGWTAPGYSNTPVYRLYNPNAGDHHYTMSGEERRALGYAGWRYEGIGWYSDDSKAVPLLRQYNPNAKAGAHNFTTSTKERDDLVKLGWKDEGTAWYGVKA